MIRTTLALAVAATALTATLPAFAGGINPGLVQEAYLAGVQPGVYTAAELNRIQEAQRENDREELHFVLSGESRKPASPAYVVTEGEAMLAAIAGVDAADYTLSELIMLQPESSNDD